MIPIKTRLLLNALIVTLCLPSPIVHAVNDNLPDLGDVATSTLSTLDEKKLGRAIMNDIRANDRHYLNDPETTAWLQQLGQTLVQASAMRNQNLTFFLVDQPSINAFALPGGYIGVHSGLILTAHSESELASVLSHEIAHVSQRHIAQLFGKRGQSNLLMLASIFAAALAARNNPELSQAALIAGQAGAIQTQLSYSRAFEREADRIGLTTLNSAGFDIRGMSSFFERLQQNSRLYANNAPAYLRTHPLTRERITDMESRIAQMSSHRHQDSSDFAYAQARLRTLSEPAAEALDFFSAELKKSPHNNALLYGLAQSQLLNNNAEQAAKTLQRLTAQAQPSPFIAQLAARIEIERKHPQQAIAILQTAQQQFPTNHPIIYSLLDLQLRNHQFSAVAKAADFATRQYPEDIHYWQLLARAETAQKHPVAAHRAQAEVYYLRGALPAAIEQLEFARNVSEDDFYTLSLIDVRLNELRRRYQQQQTEETQ